MTKYVAYTAAVINDGQVEGGAVGALEGYFQEIIPDSKKNMCISAMIVESSR
ncbi:MAG: hypothetical protein Q7J24_10600 [Desulfomicrobium sp.]|nr:hypothetical protein [Desulfomicrobium sp.]